MIKNMKMKTALTIVISFFSILCLSFLYVTTQSGMTRLMKTSAKRKNENIIEFTGCISG